LKRTNRLWKIATLIPVDVEYAGWNFPASQRCNNIWLLIICRKGTVLMLQRIIQI